MGGTFINYLILQISKNQLKYSDVIKRFPDLKEEIKECLIKNNRKDLIDDEEA